MKWLNQSTAKGFAMPFFPKKAKKRSPVASFDQSFILEPILTPSGIVDGSDDTDPSALALTLTVDLDDINILEETSGEVDNDTDTNFDSPEVDIQDSPEISDSPLLDNPVSETEIEPLSFISDPSSELEPLEGIPDEIETLDSESTATVEDISENSLDSNEAEGHTEISDTDTTEPVENISENSVNANETDITSEESEISSTEDPSQSDRIESPSEESSPLETAISDSVTSENSIEQTTSVENLSDPESGDAEISLNSDASTVIDGENLPESEANSVHEDNSDNIDPILPQVVNPQTDFTFNSGVFTVGETGVVGIDYLFDGGGYQGELAMFSLEGMNEFEPGSDAFIQEAARRALSQSELGYVVVSDLSEAARFNAALPHEGDFNYGEYLGVRTFTMRAGDKLAFMLTPNGTVQQIFASPGSGGDLRPLFSLASANPNELFHAGQIADVTGEGNTFVFEDLRVDGNSDRDYNDIVFQVRGARGEATLMDQVIDPAKDWRSSDMGQALLAYTQTYITPDPVESGLPDLLGELDDLDSLLNPSVEPEQPETSDPGSPELDANSSIEEPEESNLEAQETDSIEDIETPPSDNQEPVVEDNSDAVDETPETLPELAVEDNSEAVDEAPETLPEPIVEDNSEAVDEIPEILPEPVIENNSDAVDETPEALPEPVVENNSEDAPLVDIGENSSIENEDNNSTSDLQEDSVNQESEDSPPIDVPPAINSSEFVTRIENITTSLRNPEVAAAVGSEADVLALTTRLERLTQTLSRQETVSGESAIAIDNLLNRVEILSYPPTPAPVTLVPPSNFTFTPESQPLVGVIDTGFSGNNPDIDYSRVTLGRDWVDSDSNPLLEPDEGSEHGTHILGIIGATQDNGVGIDGINDQAPLWLGRAIGSGKWADSLVEFVDAAKESGQPNAVVNLSLDLTQINPDGRVTTRYEFTPQERAAIEYARQHNVLIVVASGNDGGVMSALGQASQEFDNIITVGASERVNDAVALSKAYDRTDYSSYGYGLDILAPGGSIDNPELSLTGDGVGTMAGSSVATAKVTGAVSQVWAANPSLSYRQVIEIIKNTATDLKDIGWDLESGAGLLNIAAAVHLAKVTKPETHETLPLYIPETWSGEGIVTPMERAAATEFMGKYYEWESYTIRSGESLSAIALRTMGNGSAPYYNFIAQRNGIANPNFISVGQQILIPRQVAAPAPPSSPPPTPTPTTSIDVNKVIAAAPNSLQVYARNSIPLILAEAQASGVTDLGQIAYILATAQHESNLGRWMEELASGDAYENRRDLGNTQPGDGRRFKGRGYVQITGRGNYANWSRRLGIDLVGQPTRASEAAIAAKILVQGMRDGSFTGVGLSRYINGSNRDFFNARRIVNGIDRATQIAQIAEHYYQVLIGAVTPSQPVPTPGRRPYQVRPGDTLSGIAQRELGNANRWQEITRVDGSTFTEAEARRLQVGQIVYLPVNAQIGTGLPVIPTPINPNPISVLPNGTLVQGSGHAVYYMENGRRRHIPDPETLTAMGLSWTSIQKVSDSDLNQISLGERLPSRRNGALVQGSGHAVYYMENGRRRHIPDPETLTAMGLSWASIQKVSDSNLNLIPLGERLPSRKNGALVQGSGHAVYYMENGRRRHIPDPETLTAMGLSWASIQKVSDSDLNQIPLGDSLPSLRTAQTGRVSSRVGNVPLSFRTSPEVRNDNRITGLSIGTEFTVLRSVTGGNYTPGNRNDWLEIQLRDGRRGFVAAYYVDTVNNEGSGNPSIDQFIGWAMSQTQTITRYDRLSLGTWSDGECVTLIARYIQDVFMNPSERSKPGQAYNHGYGTASTVSNLPYFGSYTTPANLSSNPPRRGGVISFKGSGFDPTYGHVGIVTRYDSATNRIYYIDIGKSQGGVVRGEKSISATSAAIRGWTNPK